jgi:hypothetical protein
MESQALSVRPAGVALCIAFSGLVSALIEAKLLCKLSWYYYIVLLAISVASLVSGKGSTHDAGLLDWLQLRCTALVMP